MSANPIRGENPKSVQKGNFPAEYNALANRVKTLERMIRSLSYLPEINALGLTSRQIDEQIFGTEATEVLNGKLISDPTNGVLLVRQNNSWKKIE